MKPSAGDDVFLLLIEKEQALIPLAPLAFCAAQSSARKLKASYRGALVLSRSGWVRVIGDIEVLGLWGTTVGRKTASALMGARKIRVRLDDMVTDMARLKPFVADCLIADSKRGDPYLPQRDKLDNVLMRIDRAKSVTEMFERLDIPAPEDCLDVL